MPLVDLKSLIDRVKSFTAKWTIYVFYLYTTNPYWFFFIFHFLLCFLTQIWSFTLLLFRCTVFTLKSIPTVETKAEVKLSSAYLKSQIIHGIANWSLLALAMFSGVYICVVIKKGSHGLPVAIFLCCHLNSNSRSWTVT